MNRFWVQAFKKKNLLNKRFWPSKIGILRKKTLKYLKRAERAEIYYPICIWTFVGVFLYLYFHIFGINLPLLTYLKTKMSPNIVSLKYFKFKRYQRLLWIGVLSISPKYSNHSKSVFIKIYVKIDANLYRVNLWYHMVQEQS